MEEFIKLLRKRIEEGQKELDNFVKQKEEITKNEDRARGELHGYQLALEAELRRAGKPPETPNEPISPPEPAGPATNVNKTQFIKDSIRRAGARGVTYADIRKSLAAASIIVHPNYPYHVVGGMKEKDEAEERDGRIYAK